MAIQLRYLVEPCLARLASTALAMATSSSTVANQVTIAFIGASTLATVLASSQAKPRPSDQVITVAFDQVAAV